ncbi:MAG: hypothetical protein WCF47_19085, partial [Pseudolabrys sp.]
GMHTPVSKSLTVAQAAEEWIKGVALERREASTLAQYRQHAHHITQRIGNQKLASLTTPRLNAFRDELLTSMSRPMGRKVMTPMNEPAHAGARCARRRSEWRGGCSDRVSRMR